MYASVRKYRVDPDQVDDLMHRVDETFAPRIEAAEGFIGYEAIDCGDGTVFTISTFADLEGAAGSNRMAAEFVRAELADFDIERLEACEGLVNVSRAASEMLEPAHA